MNKMIENQYVKRNYISFLFCIALIRHSAFTPEHIQPNYLFPNQFLGKSFHLLTYPFKWYLTETIAQELTDKYDLRYTKKQLEYNK